MAKFNPDFWEVTISAEGWGRFAVEDGLRYESHEDAATRHRGRARASELAPALRRIIDEVLTERQREVVMLFFYEGMNQRQISEALGITQQVVSEHLYGKQRDGRAVGGAIRKLKKACVVRGISSHW